jgi:hypothetical protein
VCAKLATYGTERRRIAPLDQPFANRRLRDVLELTSRENTDKVAAVGHYEGRGWPGFHHHGTLCIAVYGFLISEREMIPPQDLIAPGKLPTPRRRRSGPNVTFPTR